jgi:hypothetical protein
MSLDADRQTLEASVAALLLWEQRKRSEKTLLLALAVALLAALAVPLFVTLPPVWAWSAPLALFALIAPALFHARRWRAPDTARSLAAFDKALASGERVTTAWELAQRNDTRAVALLVLRHACERVQGANVRALFPRRWKKREFVAVPLFGLWLALHMFEAQFTHPGGAPHEPATLARELRDFARRLQEKARVEGLPKTIETARELEQLAQRGIDAKTGENAFQREVAKAQQKIAVDTKAAAQASTGAAQSQRQLEDLKTELQTARDWLAASGSAAQSWDEVLGKLTELRRHGEWRQDKGGKELSRDEIGAFLNKLDQRVTAELDRRALQQTERHLKQLAQRGQEGDGGTRPGTGGKGKQDDTLAQIPEGQPSAPGTKPGTASGNATPPPNYTVGTRSAVKGTIGEGASSSIFLKGKPTAGKSMVAEDAVIAAYQRRAEAELNNEQIPGELKGAIRTYFLSLEESK